MSLVLSSTAGALAAEAQKDQAPAPAVSAEAMAQYRRALAEYQAARTAYAAAADAYWNAIVQQRRQRNAKRANHEQLSIDDYVLTQPPVYAGPPKPRDPSKPAEGAAAAPTCRWSAIFSPTPDRNSNSFPARRKAKRIQARLRQGRARGRAECRTNRPHLQLRGRRQRRIRCAGRARARQAGARHHHGARLQSIAGDQLGRDHRRKRRHSSSRACKRAPASLPDAEKKALQSKLAIVRKMIDFGRSVPDDWNKHQVLANTPKGLGVHALNLDVDVGPYLQTQKLMDSVNFARRKGFRRVDRRRAGDDELDR